jgi:hypothetical protein
MAPAWVGFFDEAYGMNEYMALVCFLPKNSYPSLPRCSLEMLRLFSQPSLTSAMIFVVLVVYLVQRALPPWGPGIS